MPTRPKILYFLYHSQNPVSSRSKIWTSPLPLHPNRSDLKPDAKAGTLTSYGDYFQIVRKFLEKDRFELLAFAISQQILRKINPEEIKRISVCLEKHGAFYHPARIEVILKDFWLTFVLNLAISKAGRNCIEKEYHALEKLNHIIQKPLLPKVYGRAEIRLKGNQKAGMFLGEWFDGYHEFHISRDPADDTHKIRVWDPEHQGFYLSPEQSMEVYRQASWILTCCYNVETTEQIFFWHHASGDFIVKLENYSIDVKLITVRSYDAALKDMDKDTKVILNALLVFFLNLTIRMRLDRIDGVGEIVWSDDLAVSGTIKGFFEGLAQKPPTDLLPGPINTCFQYYLQSCSYSQLREISQAIANAYHLQAPERSVVKRCLEEHLKTVCRNLKDL
jgi:hypothetical protein